MNIIFSDKVAQILDTSRQEAAKLSSNIVRPEHLLLGILSDGQNSVKTLLNRREVNMQGIVSELVQTLLESDEPQVLPSSIPNNAMVVSDEASKLLRLAVHEARKTNETQVNEMHLLLAMLSDKNTGREKYILNHYEVSYEDVARATIVNSQSREYEPVGADGEVVKEKKSNKKEKSKTPLLDQFSEDLTAKAREQELDPVVGRDKEVARITEILCRRKKNNPVLIGEPGVGKSAIVEGLAQQIANRTTSPMLHGKRILNLDMSLIVAGTKYRGQFEERLKGILQELEENPDIIVFIDEIHGLIGAGNAAGNMDAANIMKPALARGRIQCIGATTLDEYRKSIEKDGALERRFQKLVIEAPTVEETLQILTQLAPRYAKYHNVNYSEEAIEACVTYSERYINARQFPDKAIDVLDEVGAKVRLRNTHYPQELVDLQEQINIAVEKKLQAVKEQNFELAASYRDRQVVMERQLADLKQTWNAEDTANKAVVKENDVAEAVSIMSGIPVQRLTEGEHAKLKDLANRLNTKVIGQGSAVAKVVKAIQRNRVGLKAKNKPIGVFMFLGPTGVGKTHLANQLALEIFGTKEALIRVDMSEYTESFNTSRLIGAPPGYVGYDEGGQLTERVRRKPYSIVLLDEIEKAHQNVYNMLLQVLDEGRLTDGNGRVIDFTNTIIILTSNTGTRQLREFQHSIGFKHGENVDAEHAKDVIKKALSKQFAPEFINRLDDVITFDQLNQETIKQIVDLELQPLAKRVEELGYKLTVPEDVKTLVAEKGYDVQYGARPLKRAIQTYIEDVVCDRLLSDELKLGDEIIVEQTQVN